MRGVVAVLLLHAGATTTTPKQSLSTPLTKTRGGPGGVGADEKQQGCTTGLTVTGSPNAALNADYYADTFSLCGSSSFGTKSLDPSTEMMLGSSWLGSSCTIVNGSCGMWAVYDYPDQANLTARLHARCRGCSIEGQGCWPPPGPVARQQWEVRTAGGAWEPAPSMRAGCCTFEPTPCDNCTDDYCNKTYPTFGSCLKATLHTCCQAGGWIDQGRCLCKEPVRTCAHPHKSDDQLACPSGCGAARCNATFVDASCWWDPDAADGNATAAIAAALATRARTVSIPAMDRPWLVAPVPGLSYASAVCKGSHPTVICLDQNSSGITIIFEPGVLVLAKRNEFHGLGDTLLRANNVHGITLIGHGATLRMRRADYGNTSQYAHSEFRHDPSLDFLSAPST